MARPTPIMLSEAERSELEALDPQPFDPAASGASRADDRHGGRRRRRRRDGERLGVWRKGVSFWRARWLAGGGESAAERLADAPRSGAPATITPEQICAIVALACERPEDGGVPLSQWSASDLAREAVRRGIVTSISPRSVGRFLKRIRPQAASGSSLAHAQARS